MKVTAVSQNTLSVTDRTALVQLAPTWLVQKELPHIYSSAVINMIGTKYLFHALSISFVPLAYIFCIQGIYFITNVCVWWARYIPCTYQYVFWNNKVYMYRMWHKIFDQWDKYFGKVRHPSPCKYWIAMKSRTWVKKYLQKQIILCLKHHFHSVAET